MSDWLNNLYFFNTILNIFSTSFTILFLLYRFTSLFTYIIGFLKFCGKLFKGILYIKNKIVNYLYPNDYTNIKYETNYNRDLENNYTTDGYTYRSTNNDDSINRDLGSIYDDENNKSFFTKCKNSIYKWLFPRKKQYNVLPVYETRTSYINSESIYSDLNRKSGSLPLVQQTPQQMEAKIINEQLYYLSLEDNDSDEDELTESIPLLHQNNNTNSETTQNLEQNVERYISYNPTSGRLEQTRTEVGTDPNRVSGTGPNKVGIPVYPGPNKVGINWNQQTFLETFTHNDSTNEYQSNDLVQQFNNLSLK